MKPINRIYRFIKDIDSQTSSEPEQQTGEECEEKDANVITSLVFPNIHAPVLDIDFEAKLLPSSTPGHYHLYLEKAMTWPQYRRLLWALADAEIIEPGYAAASVDKGWSAVRKPGVYKPVQP